MGTRSILEMIRDGDRAALRARLEKDPALAGDPLEGGVSPLLTALYMGRPDLAAIVGEFRTEPDLFESAAWGDLPRVQQHLDRDRALAGTYAPDGFAPLHLAAFFARPDVVAYLLRAGAEAGAEAQNPTHVQPLHSMAAGRSADVARLLLAAGADPNAAQAGGWTPLQAATRHGDADVVRVLLEYGADPDQPADDGSTARAFATDRPEILVLFPPAEAPRSQE